MDVRAQVSMTFHLDKCIGCHTCSIACKNHWTSRKGAEYMWWNNVETKPGTGYPTRWEDQEKYQGGFERDGDGRARLKLQDRFGVLANLFSNPVLPTVDDYYEPWTYSYQDLFDSPEGDDQPTARPISLITGEHVDVDAGPNWDDDLGGSPVYANNDPNLDDLSEEEKQQLFTLERMVFFYLPRICNHCINAGCVAACPAGAIYKRGEDGIVLINQDKCRAWRMCISGCPYKKPYFNWHTGKSEKCILCFPRLESGEAPACFHACVGRIRYLGVVLYDADRIQQAIEVPDAELVEAHRSIVLDPFDPDVIAGAKETGINDQWIKAAQKSPVYKFFKEWKIALPLHPEFRTLPMLFYIPPLLPVMASLRNGSYEIEAAAEEFFSSKEQGRIGVRYLASLFAAGNVDEVRPILAKMLAVRTYMRATTAGDVDTEKAGALLEQAGLDAETAEAIYKLTSLPTFEDRFVLPPIQREGAIDAAWPQDGVRQGSHDARGATGVGHGKPPKRGY